MTLITTFISREGIIHAADSNVTTNTFQTEKCCKAFEARHLNAGLNVCGGFEIGRIGFDVWIQDFINEQAHFKRTATIRMFAEELRGRLQAEMTSDEKAPGTLVYVGGFEPDADGSHPEIYAVRNMGLDHVTGEYTDGGYIFESDEQFWTRDLDGLRLRPVLASGRHIAYVNGFLAGRAAFIELDRRFQEFLESVWTAPTWKFRRPRTLEEREEFIKVEMNAIIALFASADYAAPFIGGEVTTIKIAPPSGLPWFSDATGAS